MENSLDPLLEEIRACRMCEKYLPLGPKPILNLHPQARILIIGQAPGIRAHESGKPWNDASGERLRDWMGLSSNEFYDPRKLAVVPMGFCYPGKGKSGDLPPRPECSSHWMEKVLTGLVNVQLKVLIGSYAQRYFLGKESLLTENIQNWKKYFPEIVVLPHPSPRNNIWLKRNSWFEKEILPALKKECRSLLQS